MKLRSSEVSRKCFVIIAEMALSTIDIIITVAVTLHSN